jgi:hypothetical protein
MQHLLFPGAPKGLHMNHVLQMAAVITHNVKLLEKLFQIQ